MMYRVNVLYVIKTVNIKVITVQVGTYNKQY